MSVADRHQAAICALEIVNRGNLLPSLEAYLTSEAIETVRVSKHDDTALREAAYFQMKAVESLVSKIKALADEARPKPAPAEYQRAGIDRTRAPIVKD